MHPISIVLSLALAQTAQAITCLTIGSTATATWKNAAGQTCRWSGTVGSNFGRNSVNGGEYVVVSRPRKLMTSRI